MWIIRAGSLASVAAALVLLAENVARGQGLQARVAVSKPARTVRGPTDSADQVVVKFREGTAVRLRAGGLTAAGDDLSSMGQILTRARIDPTAIGRAFTRPEADLDAERGWAQARSGHELADLNLYFTIDLPAGVDIESFCDELNALPFVELAVPAPLPMPPPVDIPPATPDFSGFQGYRGPPPLGIGVPDPVLVPGSDGTGTAIVDIEYNWVLNHEDLELPPSANVDPATLSDPFPGDEHGTAVLGELGGGDNGYGVVGIVPGAELLVAPANTVEFGYNVARAISVATGVLGPGDVILLEQQNCVCGGACRFGPVEYFQATFDAIATATALGIVVVEAAGNGSVDLDAPDCGGLFDRSIRDSGAIIVGAGNPANRTRLSFSTYGSRVDVQGWGSSVTTTGYGGLFNPGDVRQHYTASFNGTSSASPIVAGAVLAIQGNRIARGLQPLTPSALRELLIDTGTPQAVEPEHIGPLPNLSFLAQPQTEWFTQLFDAADYDLQNRMLTFTPTGSDDFYSACQTTAASFPTDPTGGNVLLLSDDDSVAVSLSGGAQVSLYGAAYSSFFVGSNGYLTFIGGDARFDESFSIHFDQSRISALFDDLNPAAGGTVSWKQLADRIAVTFENVPEFNTANANSFQVEVFFDGTIRITHLDIAATEGLVGLSEGVGLPVGFIESDLSSYEPCSMCVRPEIIPAAGGVVSGVTTGSGTLTGTCGPSAAAAEKAFAWTPSISGVATIETCGAGTDYDSVIYLRDGTCEAGLEIACNDDACTNATGSSLASRITATVTAGHTYYIVVDGFAGATGAFTLTVIPPPIAMLDLIPGFQPMLVPLDPPAGHRAFVLLSSLNSGATFVGSIHGVTSGTVQTATMGANGPEGDDFPLLPGKGVLADVALGKSLPLHAPSQCNALDLVAGLNVIGFPCLPIGYSAFQMLASLGDTTIAGLQRFDLQTGRFESAFFSAGAMRGSDFTFRLGEAYLVHMKVDHDAFIP